MHESLQTAEWKKVIGSPIPSAAAPLTKKLESYAKINGAVDADEEIEALEEINVLALSLKKKLAKDADVAGHLEKMAKGAIETKKKVEARAAKEEAEAENHGKDLLLARMLLKAVKLTAESPLYFALALGKLSGLVIAKMVSGTHKAKAIAARTRNNDDKKVSGKILLGRCYGANSRSASSPRTAQNHLPGSRPTFASRSRNRPTAHPRSR